MNKRVFINILILFLVSSSCFLVFRYIASLKEDVAAFENQKQNLLQDIEKEKQALEKEKSTSGQFAARNEKLKHYLKGAHSRLKRSFAQLSQSEEQLARLKAKFSVLSAENGALLGERDRLSDENQTLKAKLDSANELKKSAGELKKQTQKQGNQGFLTKSGQPDSASKVKIEVNLAPVK